MRSSIFSQKTKAELVKLLYQQSKFALWPESLAALSLTFALWGVKNPYLLLGWLTYNLLICGFARHLLVFFYKKRIAHFEQTEHEIFRWLMLFALGAFLSGISWGMVGSLLMVKNDIVRETFIVFLLIGITSAANPLYSPVRSVYALFLLPAFVPFVIWLLFQGNLYILLSLLALVFIIIMLATSFYAHRLIATSLRLQFEKSALVENLSEAKTTLENHTHALEKSLSLVRATLEATTDGILVVNAEDKIEDCNQKLIGMWNIPFSQLKNQSIHTMYELVAGQLVDPKIFIDKINKLHTKPETESFDELFFKDGRVYERYSYPQHIGNKPVGRVWSFRDVTGRKFLEEKLFHQANFDSLTGLPNRVLVLDRLSQSIIAAKRYKSHLAVLFLDLDRFKLINDNLGHSLGDKLLKAVAERLTKCVRENDTVSRQGGDEFLILLNSLHNEAEVVAVARKCLEVLSEPFLIEGNKFTSTSSIGISFYPRDGEEAEILIRNADIAMYRAKEIGRNNFQFFTEEMNKKVQTRLIIENQMRDALDQHQFFVMYQPIIDVKSRQIIAIEALLRWHDAQLGLVPPSEFIPVAEESGMIIPIGEWVLRAACLQTKAWQLQGIPPIPIAVNLSASQLKQSNFFERITQLLTETALNPRYLTLELTESIIMDNIEKNIEILSRMKKMGMTVVIDDFGIGYSSLNYLKRLPVDKLKIDKSFIQDIPQHADDKAITAAMIALGKSLNLKVIAEGVENKDQLNFLIGHQCDEIQGLYFSEPLNPEICTMFLRKNKMLLLSPHISP